MDSRIRGAIKEGLIYYIGGMAALLTIINMPAVFHQLLGFIIVITGGYGAYLNYILGRISRAIILGCIALFFVPLVQSSSNPGAWRPFCLLAGILFTAFFIATILKTIKRMRVPK